MNGFWHVFVSDSLGSGDDDEDNDLEDSSAEIENDQVYFYRGKIAVYLAAAFLEFCAITAY